MQKHGVGGFLVIDEVLGYYPVSSVRYWLRGRLVGLKVLWCCGLVQAGGPSFADSGKMGAALPQPISADPKVHSCRPPILAVSVGWSVTRGSVLSGLYF